MDRVGAIVAEEARKLGAQVEIIPNKETGDHVLARFRTAKSPMGERSVSAVEEERRQGDGQFCCSVTWILSSRLDTFKNSLS